VNRHYLFHLPNDIAELMQLAGRIRKLPDYRRLGEKCRYVLDLALEEMASNIIKYGYDDRHERSIEIEIDFSSPDIELKLRDDGHEFNPLNCGNGPVQGDLEELNIGGMGICLIRNLVKSMEYHRRENCNELTIRIERGPEAASVE